MNYTEKFKQLLKSTIVGFLIGLCISILFTILVVKGEFLHYFNVIFTLTAFIFGPIAAIVVSSRYGLEKYIGTAANKIFLGIKGMFFGSTIGGGGAFFVIGAAKAIIGAIIMIPVILYMALSYVLNFLYFGIMALLEKGNKIQDKKALCESLDKMIPILAAIGTVLLIIVVFTYQK